MLHVSTHTGNENISLLDYVNLFVLLTLSGINFFIDNDNYLILAVAVNSFLFIIRKEKIDNGFFFFLLFFIFLTIAQTIWLSDGSFQSTLGFFLKLILPYLVLRNCSNFLQTFLNIIFFLSIAALFFYILFLIFPSLENFLFNHKHFWDYEKTNDVKKSLIIYNIFYEPSNDSGGRGLFGLPRNSGPFWEPGAFAGYLTLAITLEMILFRKFSWRIFFLLLALVSTFSTMGYAVIGLFFLSYFVFLETNKKRKQIIVPALLILLIFMSFNLEFLTEKVMGQVQQFNEGQIYISQSTNDTRIGSAALDFSDLQRSPLFGTGPADETRYGKNEILFMRTNGVTDILVRLGIVGFIFLFWHFFLSFKRFFIRKGVIKPNTTTCIAIFILFFISLSETFFLLPFFWSLALLQYAEVPDTEIYAYESSSA
jgi:hypothetical protein